MKKRYLFLILSLILFTFFAGCNRSPSEREHVRPSFRHPHKGGPEDFPEPVHFRIDKMAEELNLSSDQVEALKEIEKEIMKKQSEMRRERKHKNIVKGKIVEMVKKDSLSKEQIIAFMDELHALGEECRKETDSFVAERLAKMHSILTEEQREKLAKKLEEFEPERKFKPKRDRK